MCLDSACCSFYRKHKNTSSLFQGGFNITGLRRSSLRRSVKGLSVLALVLSLTSFSAAASGSQSMGDAKFVDVDGVRTRYFEGGSGEAILLVHGGHFGSSGGGAVGWMPIFSRLAAHFNVYAIDKLGMGLTDKPKSDEEYSMQATAQQLYRFLQILGIDQVHLVGHSRGGLPVANIAVNYPEMVKTLTIFDSNTLALEDPPPHSPNLSPPGPIPTKESIWESLMSSGSTFHKDYVTDEYVEAQLESALEGREKNGDYTDDLTRTPCLRYHDRHAQHPWKVPSSRSHPARPRPDVPE